MKRLIIDFLRVSMVAVGLSVCLGACGKTATPESNQASTNNEESYEPSSDISSDESDEEISDELQVENNCSYFVKVGERVYFREYGEKALEPLALWGDFLDNPTGESSFIKCYDLETGKTDDGFIDWGFGNIVYMDGIFFMNGLDLNTEYNDPYIYAVDLSGQEIKLPQMHYGTIKGISEDESLFFAENIRNDGEENVFNIIAIGSTGEAAFTVTSEKPMYYLGNYNGYLIYEEKDYDDEVSRIMSVPLSTKDPGKDTILMHEIEYDDLTYVDIQGIKTDLSNPDSENCYLIVEQVEGSGGMFNNGMIISVNPKEKQSGQIIEEIYPDESNDFNMPGISIDKGSVNVFDKAPGEYYVKQKGLENPGDLMYKDYDGKDVPVIRGFITGADYYEKRDNLLVAEYVDELCFIMRSKMAYDQEGSVGWRDGFRLLCTDYMVADHTGEAEIISSVKMKDTGSAAPEDAGIVIDEICNISGTYEDNVENVYEYEYTIPKFSLPDGGTTDYIRQVNREMLEIYDDYVKPQLDAMESGSSLYTHKVFYSVAEKGNIISVMVTIDTDWDLIEYRCYNFMSNGSKAELKDVLSLYDKNEEDFYKDVEELIKEDFPSLDSKELIECYEATMDAIHSETAAYIDEDLRLHCVVRISIPAGAGYYHENYLYIS